MLQKLLSYFNLELREEEEDEYKKVSSEKQNKKYISTCYHIYIYIFYLNWFFSVALSVGIGVFFFFLVFSNPKKKKTFSFSFFFYLASVFFVTFSICSLGFLFKSLYLIYNEEALNIIIFLRI
jgi:uncharacterized membrane protein